jgi:hypothetical protein
MDEHSSGDTRDTKKSIIQRMLLPSSLGLSLVAKLSSLFVQRGVQRNAQEQPRKRRNRCQQKFFGTTEVSRRLYSSVSAHCDREFTGVNMNYDE